MTKKARAIAIIMLAIVCGFGFAQESSRGNVDITLDVRMNVAQVDAVTYSDVDERSPIIDFVNYTHYNLGPLDGNWFTKDSTILFSYTQDRFGGSIRLNPQDFGIPPWKAWLMLGPMFRITAGNDIETLYADPQGADPGLRVYNGTAGSNGWNGSLNPDNITQDRGLLLEGFFGPLTAAVAGLVLNPRDRPVIMFNDTVTDYWELINRNFQIGARVGYELESLGKFNLSYYLLYNQTASDNSHIELDGTLYPTMSNVETQIHYVGVYASLTPMENLGVTIGYGGVFNQLLDEFWPQQFRARMETVQPLVIQNAFMVNAQYKDLIPGLTLRTDHNLTFWMDKDLSSFWVGGRSIPGWDNVGMLSKTQHPNAPDVAHLMVWNGLGGFYRLTDILGVELYMRNLFRRGSAIEDNVDHILTRNEFFIEPKLVLSITSYAGMSFALALTHTTIVANDALNYKGRNLFTGVNSRRLQETRDTRLLIQVPIGFTMQF